MTLLLTCLSSLATDDFAFVLDTLGLVRVRLAKLADLRGDLTDELLADMDASPTKAWLIEQRDNPAWKWHYDFAFGKRPAEELYDLKSDPEQTKNVASDPAYGSQKRELSSRLMKLLTDAKDPRVTGDGQTFDRSPFTDAAEDAGSKKGKKGK